MAAPFFCIFPAHNSCSLIGFRPGLVLILAFRARFLALASMAQSVQNVNPAVEPTGKACIALVINIILLIVNFLLSYPELPSFRP